MKILFIGEIVAKPGREAVKKVLPSLIAEEKPDLILSNAENIAHGRGVTQSTLTEMLSAGINFFTGGDHMFWHSDFEDEIETSPVIRPANFPPGTPGDGFKILDVGKEGKVLIINLMGRTAIGSSYLDDPFRKADEILELHHSQIQNNEITAVFIDFHAEVTSEKNAFAFYLDGRADVIVGSHTHIPTCDHRILPKGTAYVTDVGMTGNIDSVLGVKKEIIIKQFLTSRNQKFEWEENGAQAFRSVLIDTKEKSIIRVDKYL